MSDEKTNDGGPAFPVTAVPHPRDGNLVTPGDWIPNGDGMTLRDYFAAKALAGLSADPKIDWSHEWYAAHAYRLADAMLAERAKRGGR